MRAMWILLIRALLIAGASAAFMASSPLPWGLASNLVLGAAVAAAMIFMETSIRAANAQQVAGAFLGALFGVLFAFLVSVPLAKIPMVPSTQILWQSLALLFFAYVGLMLGWKKGEWFDPLPVKAYFHSRKAKSTTRVLPIWTMPRWGSSTTRESSSARTWISP